MAWFGLVKEKAEVQKSAIENKDIECFRSVDTEGMDLAQPFVDDYLTRGLGYVMFGESNLYPQIMNQLYISAPMHQACCNFKKYSLIGNGYEWEGYEKLDVSQKIEIKQFESSSRFRKATIALTLDFIKHGRAIVLINKKLKKFKFIDPENFRNTTIGLFEDSPQKYFYSRDWSHSMAQRQFRPFSESNTDDWQILEIRNEVGGFNSYGMPDWVSSANWAKVGADMSLLHKSGIENGIQPSVIFNYPYLMSDKERSDWATGMQKNAKGAKNYGRAMKMESSGKELSPEVTIVPTSENHALFEQTSKEYKEEVAISHGINPALMGVRIAGSLGANEEIEFSAEQFKKLWVNENRKTMEDFFNHIISIFDLPSKIKINETDILTAKEIIQNAK